MTTCPACRHPVAATDKFCVQCAAKLPGSTFAEASCEWLDFNCWDGSFSLVYPADWKRADPPVSDGASLSCVGPGGYKLLEAFGYYREGEISPGEPDIVAITVEGLEQTLGLEAGHANVKFHQRGRVDFREAEHAERLIVSYTDRGLETTSDYFLVGDQRQAVMLALKVLTPDYEETLPLYEHVLSSLTAPWLPA